MGVAQWRPWTAELERWLEPFLEALGRKERRRWAPLYLHGLLSPAPRKNVEQIAEHVAPSALQQLHHFVSTSPWRVRPVRSCLSAGGPPAHPPDPRARVYASMSNLWEGKRFSHAKMNLPEQC